MDWTQLLASDFRLTDELSPDLVDALSSASERLETPLPRPPRTENRQGISTTGSAVHRMTGADRSDARERARLRQERYEEQLAARKDRIASGVRQCEELVESSGFNYSVLVVYMRLLVEADGAPGCAAALHLTNKLLGAPWEGLNEALTGASERAGGKRVERWARHLDSVFDQVFDYLSRNPEEFKSHDWREVPRLGPGLAARSLRVSRYQSVEQVLVDAERERIRREEAMTSENDDSAVHGGGMTAQDRKGEEVGRERPDSGFKLAAARDGAVTLRVSPQFAQLQARLEAFTQLLSRGQFMRASLVAADLQRTLENFDVAAFFPDLFADFFVGCAHHAGELAQFGGEGDDPRWNALYRLYQTDLDRFLNLEAAESARVTMSSTAP